VLMSDGFVRVPSARRLARSRLVEWKIDLIVTVRDLGPPVVPVRQWLWWLQSFQGKRRIVRSSPLHRAAWRNQLSHNRFPLHTTHLHTNTTFTTYYNPSRDNSKIPSHPQRLFFTLHRRPSTFQHNLVQAVSCPTSTVTRENERRRRRKT
jgi:hypothetical protein